MDSRRRQPRWFSGLWPWRAGPSTAAAQGWSLRPRRPRSGPLLEVTHRDRGAGVWRRSTKVRSPAGVARQRLLEMLIACHEDSCWGCSEVCEAAIGHVRHEM
jgi:hypothetical protein